MGYKIAASHPEIKVKKADIPKFYEGFLLQWLNPKAWIACVSGVSISEPILQFFTIPLRHAFGRFSRLRPRKDHRPDIYFGRSTTKNRLKIDHK